MPSYFKIAAAKHKLRRQKNASVFEGHGGKVEFTNLISLCNAWCRNSNHKESTCFKNAQCEVSAFLKTSDESNQTVSIFDLLFFVCCLENEKKNKLRLSSFQLYYTKRV